MHTEGCFMVEAQKRPGDEGVINSAAQLRGLSWEGVRRTALDVVESFCQRNGLNPGEFMANLGMMRSDQWRQGVNWRDCVNWNQFNGLIFSSIPAEREGGSVVGRRFEAGQLTRTLREMQESYVAGTAQRTDSRTARTPTAAEQQESAPAPRRDEQTAQPAPTTAQPRSQMSNEVWSRLYSSTENVLDGYPQLTEDQRTAIHGIMDRAGPGGRRLVAVNLTAYLRTLNEERTLSADQATNLYNALVGSEERPGLAVQAERWIREGRETRLPEPTRVAEQRERPAPARTESHVYQVSVIEPAREEGGTPRTISTFEVVSPTPIEGSTDLANVLRDRPAGLAVTRIGSGGRRIRIQGDQLDTFSARMAQLRFDPNHEIAITEQQPGRPRI
jgi:hypothetical protein